MHALFPSGVLVGLGLSFCAAYPQQASGLDLGLDLLAWR